MRIAIFISLGFIFLIGAFYFFTGYRSAFEADQKCHFLLATEYPESSGYACDHDLETKQWLLYKSREGDYPAKVIRRFRY